MFRLLPLSFVLLAACAPPGATLGDLGESLEDSGASRQELLEAGAVGWVEPENSLATVATVHWQTPWSSRGRVSLREVGAERWTDVLEEDEPAEEHAWVLRGLAAETDYEVRIEPELEGDAPELELQVATGALPDWLPDTGADGGAFDGYLLVPVEVPGTSDSVGAILDGQGRLVWYDEDPGWVTRIRVAPDRQSLVLLRHSPTVDGDGSLVWLSWDREILRQETLPGLHTDFTFLPDGRVAVLGRETRDLAPGRPFLGETIVVFEPDGSHEVVWHVLDELPPDLGELYPPCPEAIGVECYSHLNSLAYDEDQDALLLTAASMESALLLDRATGAVRWVLGGPESDLEVPGLESPLGYPHSAQLVPGGVLVFDDRSPIFEGCSGVVEFSLDLEHGEARPGWKYQPAERVVNHFLGNAQRLDDGRTLAVVSDLGVMDIVDIDGHLEQRISTQHPAAVRYGQAVESLYP